MNTAEEEGRSEPVLLMAENWKVTTGLSNVVTEALGKRPECMPT